MGPFAAPVPGFRLGIHPHGAKRRKTGAEQEHGETEPEWDIPSHLPQDSINPLSHPPDVLRQFRVAGLSVSDEIPSKAHPLFPHKPLPSEAKQRRRTRRSTRSANVSEAESEAESGVERQKDRNSTTKQLSERLRHLSTLTAIMHRCLDDGDIARAKRAFALLVRTKDVDIRQGGLWAVGSEILMRDGETEERLGRQRQQQQQQQQQQQRQAGGDDENVGGGDERQELRRWGSAANIEKVTSYFENLIQQYPHDQHRPYLTSALDFWPALFGIEIYNLDAEFRQALHRLREREEEEEDAEDRDVDIAPEDMAMEMAYSDDAFEAHRQRRDEERHSLAWTVRDELKMETMEVAVRVTGRMDQVMENAPFATHREMLRLRANLALFIGDLYIPSRLVVDEDGVEGVSLNNVEDMLRSRAELAEEHNALAQRREEMERARRLFRKILDGGGEVDDWVRKFVLTDEDEDEGHDTAVDDVW
ncbi:hypothetical protein F4776DRAFT_113862 [Hypoxylon sp. NC0597]|nr:hypothetical protein F4776DRAFT_113862 [Hypoxylon sp. NC0597]